MRNEPFIEQVLREASFEWLERIFHFLCEHRYGSGVITLDRRRQEHRLFVKHAFDKVKATRLILPIKEELELRANITGCHRHDALMGQSTFNIGLHGYDRQLDIHFTAHRQCAPPLLKLVCIH